MYQANFLIANRLQHMFDVLKAKSAVPERVLDFSGSVTVREALQERYPKAEIVQWQETAKNTEKSKVNAKPKQSITHYDLIVILGGFNEEQDPERAYQLAKELLAENGVMYVDAPDHLAYSKGESGWRTVAGGGFRKGWHMTRLEWQALFERVGLSMKNQYTGEQSIWRFVWLLERKEKESDRINQSSESVPGTEKRKAQEQNAKRKTGTGRSKK